MSLSHTHSLQKPLHVERTASSSKVSRDRGCHQETRRLAAARRDRASEIASTVCGLTPSSPATTINAMSNARAELEPGCNYVRKRNQLSLERALFLKGKKSGVSGGCWRQKDASAKRRSGCESLSSCSGLAHIALEREREHRVFSGNTLLSWCEEESSPREELKRLSERETHFQREKVLFRCSLDGDKPHHSRDAA